MDSLFKISKYGTYGIAVEGLEKDNSEYLLETDILVSTRNYAYSHSVTINALTSINAVGDEKFETSSVNFHQDTSIDSSEFILSKDGLYKISHIILPNEIWLAYVLARDVFALDNYNFIYYYNEVDQKLYKYSGGISTEVTLLEVMKAAYIDSILPGDKVTTIIRSDKNTFITYYLAECLSSISKSILVRLPLDCDLTSDTYKNLVFKRDVIWMATNVIKYHLGIAQFYEAQRVLENVITCNSFCNPIVILNTNYGCGCNK